MYQLLEFHTQCVALVRERFNDAAVYKQKMRLAWERIVNPPASLIGSQGTSEMLSYFFDSVLRGSRGKNRLGVDDQKKWCAQAINLWDYLNDKVLFMETYATHLMHRLLKVSAIVVLCFVFCVFVLLVCSCSIFLSFTLGAIVSSRLGQGGAS